MADILCPNDTPSPRVLLLTIIGPTIEADTHPFAGLIDQHFLQNMSIARSSQIIMSMPLEVPVQEM